MKRDPDLEARLAALVAFHNLAVVEAAGIPADVIAEVFTRAEGRCEYVCMSDEYPLELHHCHYRLDRPVTAADLMAVCPTCHLNLHIGPDGFNADPAVVDAAWDEWDHIAGSNGKRPKRPDASTLSEDDLFQQLLTDVQRFKNPLAAGTAITKLAAWWISGFEGDDSDRAHMLGVFDLSLTRHVAEADDAARLNPGVRQQWLSGGSWPGDTRKRPSNAVRIAIAQLRRGDRDDDPGQVH